MDDKFSTNIRKDGKAKLTRERSSLAEIKPKMGEHIAALRRAKGITQEQLASALGVSAPAVSKWETDTSCPDIALLCPLARALGTNVDTLLQFEELPPESQITEWMNEILEKTRLGKSDEAEEMLQELLHRYPSSVVIKYNAAVVLTTMGLWLMAEEAGKKEKWSAQKKELLLQVREAGMTPYNHSAILQLASMAAAEDDLDAAEKLLNELPQETMQHPLDPVMVRTSVYLKRNETEKAREMLQKQLYKEAYKVCSLLMLLMSPELEPDANQALKICEIYHRMNESFGLGGGLDSGIYAEIYMRAGQTEKSFDCIVEMVKAACGKMQMPNPLLFSTFENTKKGEQPAMTKELLKALLQGLQSEERYALFREDRRYQEAVEMLRAHLT